MSLDSLIKRNWDALADKHAGRDSFWTLSPSYLVLKRALRPAIAGYCRGRVLDAGAGRLPYKGMLSSSASSYTSLDRSDNGRGHDLIGDVRDLPLPDRSFDTVFCSQVIEHVPEPTKAFAEFLRILRPGGVLILTAPHLGYLHNEPDDYYRYTNHGLRFLAEAAGFEVFETHPVGGLFAYLGHLASTATLGVMSGVPLLGPVAVTLNSLWSRAVLILDGIAGGNGRFALDFLIVAKRP